MVSPAIDVNLWGLKGIVLLQNEFYSVTMGIRGSQLSGPFVWVVHGFHVVKNTSRMCLTFGKQGAQ